MTGSPFPIYIRPELQDSSPAFAEFTHRAASASKQAADSFKADFREITGVITNALTKGVQGGRLDLDVSQLRQAAAEAKLFGSAINDTLRTAQLLATETGDTSAETRQFILAMEAASRAQDENRRSIDVQIATYTRLQSALDVTADKNSRLAQSYRETFSEAARLAQLEVANDKFGASIAPALASRATDNGAGFSALEEQLAADTRAQDRYKTAMQESARVADQYTREIAELQQQLFPVEAATANIARQTDLLTVAFKRGDISAEQYEQGLQRLSASQQLLQGSFRGARQAMIQAGQQLQDIGISLYSGQKAGVVFAQQLPQLAFALSSLEGSANKTHARIGQFATFLAGPWGLAVGLAVGVIGTLVAGLFDTEDAGNKATKSTFDFSKSLDYGALSATEMAAAVSQLNKETERLINNQSRVADAQLANANLQVAALDQEIAAVTKKMQALGPQRTGIDLLRYGFDVATESKRDSLNKEYNDLLRQRDQALESANRAQLALAKRTIDELTDTSARLKGEYERAVQDLTDQRTASAKSEVPGGRQPVNYITEDEYKRRLQALNEQHNRDLKAYQESQRKSRSTTLPPVTLREVTDLVASQLGGQITSTTGGKHVKGSYHYSGQAVDFVPKGGLGALSKADIREAFGAAGIQIKELLGPGDKGHDDHFHVAFAKRRQSVEQVNDAIRRMEEASARAAEKLQRDIDSSAESVSRLRGQFDVAPRDIDRATAAVIDLNQAIADADKKLKAGGLTADQKAVVEATKRQAEQTRDTLIPEFLKRPLVQTISTTNDQIAAQNLLIQGLDREYDRLEDNVELARMLGAESLDQLSTQIKQRGISKEMLDTYYQQRDVLRVQSIYLDEQRQRQQELLNYVDQVRDATKQGIYDIFDGKGIGAAKKFVSSLYDIVKRQLTEEIFVKLFGDAFTKQKLKILGLDQVDETGKAMASAIRVTIDPIRDLGNVASEAVRKITAANAANDNGLESILSPKSGAKIAGADSWLNDIIVTASNGKIDNLTSSIKGLGKTTQEGLGKNGAIAKGLGGFGEVLSGALRGAAVGEATSGVLKSLGIKQSKTGAQIGGAIGSFLPIPGGEIIGSIIGGTIGGLFKKTPKGSATISDLDGLSYSGSGKLRDSVSSLAGGVQDRLGQIIDALGGELGSFNVSIGQRKKKFTVDPTGAGRTKGSGVQTYATQEEAALAALRDAILDGAVKGIRAGAQRLLQAGKDLDAQLQKAVAFQGVFDRLREYEDPVGAALDKLNREFDRLKSIFAEAGASAAEYADLEKLYGLEREKVVKEAAERITASLKSLYDDLTLGDNGRSLRDRLSAAQAAYDPLKARVLAGDKTAYDAFAEAARSLLDIQRQFSGSQTPYFNLLDEITRITKERIDAEANIVSIADGRDNPFSTTGVVNPNYTPVVSAIEQQTQDLLRGFAGIVAAGGGGLSNGFLVESFR